MVLVGAPERLLRDAEQTLQLLLDDSSDDVDRAFIAFVTREPRWLAQLEAAVQSARGHRGATRSYRDVSVLGFAAEVVGRADPALAELATWLAGTSAHVSGVATGIVEDRVALLGAALAAKHTGAGTGLAAWLGPIVSSSQRDSPLDTAIVRAVARILSAPAPPGATSCPEAEVVFGRFGLLPSTSVDAAVIVDALLRGTLATDARNAVLQLTAIADVRARLPSINIARASSADVARLLGRIPAGLQQWTWEDRAAVRGGTARQWHVDHEYHVQNLLWMVLAPAFPDLRREEYTAPVGPLQPRLDIGIPSLRLIIEVKFWRDSASAADMVEQIASDSSVYFTGSDRRYDDLIPFVWDDTRRTERHHELLRGLRQLPHVVDAVVIARPAKMTAS